MSKAPNIAGMDECRKLLTEVIEQTEQAVDSIIHEIEKLQQISKNVDEQSHLSKVVEACSFQDLAGQRLRKAMKIIDQLEGKSSGNITAERQKQEDAGLLEGPSSTGKSQDDIDKLFGNN